MQDGTTTSATFSSNTKPLQVALEIPGSLQISATKTKARAYTTRVAPRH